MMSSLPVLLAATIVAGAAWASPPQAPAAKPHAVASPPQKKAPAKPKLTDAQLESAIRAKFAKSKGSADKLTVKVQGGIATIDGKTDVVQRKGSATRMARTAGAAAVNNRVQVSDAAKQKSASNLEAGRRRAQVKRGDTRSDH